MPDRLTLLLFLFICFWVTTTVAQNGPPYNNGGYNNGGYNNGSNNGNYNNDPRYQNYNDTTRNRSQALTSDQMIDTLRKRERQRMDSVIFNTRFIKITNEALLRDSTQLFPLDTSLVDFENYNPLFYARNPKISLGGTMGLAARSLLFEPRKTIGFDVGLHALDPWQFTLDDVYYFNARVPYTLLTMVTGGAEEQFFKAFHTQNVKPNWNVGFSLNFLGSRGTYANRSVLGQNVSNLTGNVFSWYESTNKRYNLLTTLIFNNIKSPETGSVLNDSLFTSARGSFDKNTERVRLPNSFSNQKETTLHIKQFYYVGRIDTTLVKNKSSANILPTQRFSHTLNVSQKKYIYQQGDQDVYHVFPDYYFSSNRTKDSLTVNNIQNEFSYSFYLRGKSSQFVKNEFKLDVGLTHDLYSYNQYVVDTTLNEFGVKVVLPQKQQQANFQNITLNGRASYRFSDKLSLQATVNQIVVGRNFGDFLYDAKLLLSGNDKAGRIVLNAYQQSSSPSLVATSWVSNHYIFNNSFANQKTTALSFNYINDALALDVKAEYFLLNDYLYYESSPGGNDAHPVQLSSPINLLKISAGKNLAFGNWHFDNFVVYQKTDYQKTLRIPEVYTYSSLYLNSFLFKVLRTSTGVTVRYNTPYSAPSYAVGLGQFYNGADVQFSSYPFASVFLKANIKNTDLLVMYDYANQGLFSKGYYTVYRYPQLSSMLKFGVRWNFYQ
ncbi:putative porin [Mucilaginibacter sp. HD30]